MGRTLKRVPLNFNWPMGKTWGGYLNPHARFRVDCPSCKGSGLAPDAKRFSEQWYGSAPFDPVAYGSRPLTIDNPVLQAFAEQQCRRTPDYYGTGPAAVAREARRLLKHWGASWSHQLAQADVDALVDGGRLPDFTRRPRNEEQAAQLAAAGGYWIRESNGYRPTADEVNDWSLGGMGHDGGNQYVCVKARCEREGVAHECPACGGDGELWASPEAKAASEAWTDEEPPIGDGFQLWETTSEGSPASPVFSTLDELCAWCADNATTFGSSRASAEKWREMLDEDFVRHEEGNVVFL